MLRTYGPGCDGSLCEGKVAAIPEGAAWIDLEEPTREEDAAVEAFIGVPIPTEDDMEEIEPSSRLYEKGGALFMTVSALTGVTEDAPVTEPIAFILADKGLVTLRYSQPKPFKLVADQARRAPETVADSRSALIRLMDAMIDRLADELEEVGSEIEAISSHIFAKRVNVRRIPADRLTTLLTRIGRAQTLTAKIRYSAVSTARALGFLEGSGKIEDEPGGLHKAHLHSLIADVAALTEHASFLSDQLTFQLDASLGLISIEQNAAMKLFSWAAVVFLPPTLIAGIYGMNFDFMPELKWHYGYFIALALMLASAILPYIYMKRRHWI